MITRLMKRCVPRAIRATVRNYCILSGEFGQYKTIRDCNCVDKDGNAIPWYTYPAIEYLKQLDFSEYNVFEYGSGISTIFWGSRSKQVVSIEDSEEWYEKMLQQLPDSVEYRLVKGKEAYIHAIEQYGKKFDLIVIDGKHRHECATIALQYLDVGGFIILDNSDWKEATSSVLRNADLIEVDMSGFGPINGYTWTTSFYFTRAVNIQPLRKMQPVHSIGSLSFSDFAKPAPF